MPASMSGAPLVPRTRRRGARGKNSWYQRKIARPMAKLNPWNWIGKKKRPAVPRSVFVGEPIPEDYYDKKGKVLRDKMFCSNQNITSKYTIITFLPRNLLEQFRRVANIFFLGIAILQFFPKFSTISPGLVILPLIVVLAITALKDGWEDIQRHRADHKVNYSIVHTLAGGGYENSNPTQPKTKTFIKGIPLPHRRKKKKNATTEEEIPVREDSFPDGHGVRRVRSQVSNWDQDPEAEDSPKEIGWHRTIWEDIKVGDFVKIYDHEQVPADIVICATSEEEDVAYVETKNLDGETNLKSRHGVMGLSHLDSATACASAHLRLDVDAPEVNMYRLNGAAVISGESGERVHPITLETTLLRGCVLRNTAWVIGIIIFTGDDTKIVQNSGGAPSKRSKVERQMNPQVLFNLLVLGLMSMVCAIVDHLQEKVWYREDAYWTLYDDRPGDNPNVNGIITFLNALITFQNIIPISLYISIEFVRTIQALFIYWDHDMQYHKNGNKIRTIARSWNLSDDLGQIEYIFSDKTGTLTQNVMVFRQCSVGGKVYYGDSKEEETQQENKLNTSPSNSDNSDDVENSEKKPYVREIPPFHDAQLNTDLEGADSEQSRILHGFFSVLGLCHTAVVAEPEPGVIEYKAQSPDEAALVQSAADVGFVFRGRDRNILKLSTPYSQEPDEYELLNVLEFSSARKRMSVIVRKCDEEGRLFLLCKGADNIIFERLNKSDDAQKKLQAQTDKDLQLFASEGLRTLCLAYRVLDPSEYEEWAEEYHQAEVSLDNREENIDAAAAKIECNLSLLGATAIEDKLQDGVPEAIADLKRAGIKVWVATGDKLETAVAIGYTTNLLTPVTNLIIVRSGNHSVYQQLKDSLEGFFGDDSLTRTNSAHGSFHQVNTRRSTQLARVNTGVQSLVGDDNGTRPGGFSLVIDGAALTEAFDDEDTSQLLLGLAMKCNTVVCCRVSPLQKAQIVRLVKDNLGVMCLAIGDGANDVSMIQAADVGVGISGEEGLQAVNSSDYSTGQFRYLKRLLLVHGHWSYFRNSTMICNFFYKNVVGIGILFWYMIYCGWSTTYVYAYVYLLFWNVFWTLCPVIAIGLFERNIDDDILMAIPELYRYSREGRYYNWPRFLYYLFEGVFQTAVVYFFLCYTYVTTSTRGDGYDVYKDEMSTTMAVAAVMMANLFSGLNIDAWSWWVVFAVWVGPFLIWVFTAIYSIVPPTTYNSGVYGNDLFLFRSAAYWFGWPFVLIISLLPRYLIKYGKQNIFPNDIDIMRLVRKYQPGVDVNNDPRLGGKLRVMNGEIPADKVQDYPDMNDHGGHDAENGIALKDFDNSRRSSLERPRRSVDSNPRPSFHSARNSMHSGGRPSFQGTHHDMALGIKREPSRGFGFTTEEGGVAIARMQSRLSEASKERPRYTLRRLAMTRQAREGIDEGSVSGSAPSTPFGKLRTRAGSILRSRNRSSTTATRHSAMSHGTDRSGGGVDEHGVPASPPLPGQAGSNLASPVGSPMQSHFVPVAEVPTFEGPHDYNALPPAQHSSQASPPTQHSSQASPPHGQNPGGFI